jgi:hypothetical protein
LRDHYCFVNCMHVVVCITMVIRSKLLSSESIVSSFLDKVDFKVDAELMKLKPLSKSEVDMQNELTEEMKYVQHACLLRGNMMAL